MLSFQIWLQYKTHGQFDTLKHSWQVELQTISPASKSVPVCHFLPSLTSVTLFRLQSRLITFKKMQFSLSFSKTSSYNLTCHIRNGACAFNGRDRFSMIKITITFRCFQVEKKKVVFATVMDPTTDKLSNEKRTISHDGTENSSQLSWERKIMRHK